MVVIVGYIACMAISDDARLPAKRVPDRIAAAVRGDSAFNLICSSRDTPREVCRKPRELKIAHPGDGSGPDRDFMWAVSRITSSSYCSRCANAQVSVRSAAMNRIRVVLAEDHVLLREGISRLVAAHDDLELAGTASDLPELLDLIGSEAPDVVVTDIRMPPTGTDEGIQAAAWTRQNHPATGVVVLSQYVAPSYAVALLEQGSAGRAYLLKERVASVDELARAIRAVASGGSVIDPMVVDELVKSKTHDNQPGLGSLTPRELEILAEMAQGKSNSAIATALFVTERAVEKHTNSIFAKLGLSEERDVNRRVKAVLVYLSQH
jgi:DNA-binding NarL/FixJ family response regulator